VTRWLQANEVPAFFAQGRADQRHGLEAARYAERNAPRRPDLIRAALLHDVGKRHSEMGALGRSGVTAWAKLGGRVHGRAALYLDHGRLGAGELSALGAEELVVLFTRHHHGSRPPSITSSDWDLLQQSDRPHRRRV
jgi:putative nucleotidyltransferase with HDIG domain